MDNRIPRSKKTQASFLTDNVVHWFDAESLSGADLDTISSWTDRLNSMVGAYSSGYESVLRIEDGYQYVSCDPAYVSSSGVLMGITDAEEAVSWSDGWTDFLLVRNNDDTYGNEVVLRYESSSNKEQFRIYRNKITLKYDWGEFNITGLDLNNWSVVTVKHTSSSIIVRVNGSEVGSHSHSFTATLPTTAYCPYPGSPKFAGDIADFITYKGTIPDENLASIEAYLLAKRTSLLTQVSCTGSDSTYTNGTFIGFDRDRKLSKTNEWSEIDYFVYNSGTWEIWAFDDNLAWTVIKMWTSTNGDANTIPTTGWTAVGGTGYSTPPTVAIL